MMVVKIKKQKTQKKSFIKRKLIFENYKNCLEVTHLENEIIYLEKNEIDIDSLKRDQKKFIRNNTLILKTQKRFKSERVNGFTEETNMITLSSNHEKKMQSVDLIEKSTYGTSKDLVSRR